MSTAASIEGSLFLHHDVTKERDWQRALAAAVDHFGRLDIVVNNAGIESAALLTECELADFKRVIAINVDGTFLDLKWAVRAPRPAPAGRRARAAASSTCPWSPAARPAD